MQIKNLVLFSYIIFTRFLLHQYRHLKNKESYFMNRMTCAKWQSHQPKHYILADTFWSTGSKISYNLKVLILALLWSKSVWIRVSTQVFFRIDFSKGNFTVIATITFRFLMFSDISTLNLFWKRSRILTCWIIRFSFNCIVFV